MQGGFKESPLKLNEGLGELEAWNGETIQARANKLAKRAIEVWEAPVLSEEQLDAYRPKAEKQMGYTIDDHRHLAPAAPMRKLFDEFRREVLSLDPCVSEEFLKLYVAYKAETNFVDIVPQKSRLRLSLNLPFHEVFDPRGVGKDVTNLGRWGNGDVEVGFSKFEEIPYVMGLVRQAFEKQMGNGTSDE